MNQLNQSSEHTASVQSPKSTEESDWVKIKLPLRSELHQQIDAEVARLSTQLGFKVTLANFLHKTIAENWKHQLEYYRKLEPNLKKIRP